MESRAYVLPTEIVEVKKTVPMVRIAQRKVQPYHSVAIVRTPMGIVGAVDGDDLGGNHWGDGDGEYEQVDGVVSAC